VADWASCRVRRVLIATAAVTSISTSGCSAYADGSATAARFSNSFGVAVAPAAAGGTIYIADTGNHMIRRYATTGTVTTIAGTGSAGKTNGFGDAAAFNSPDGIAVGSDGAIYVADTLNNLIRRIVLDPSGSATVSTLAGSGSLGSADGVGEAASFRGPQGLVAAPGGVLYVATVSDNLIRKIVIGADGKGTVTTIAGTFAGFKDGPGLQASFNQPHDLAIDKSGNLYVADRGNAAIRKIVIGADGKATVSTILGGGTTKFVVNSIGVAPSGKIYITELGVSRISLVK
jgi:sugar lactone lactonase YvrE